MKRVLATAILACFALVATATIAAAAGNANGKIMLHALSVTTKNNCTRIVNPNNNVPATGCPGYDAGVSNIPLYPTSRFMYLLAVNGSQTEGIAGLECGIASTQPDFTVFSWALCATLEFQTAGTTWGNNGSGNLITWDSINRCQVSGNALLGTVAVAGYWYCAGYAPTCVSVTPRPVSGLATLANCASIEDQVYTDPNDALTFLGRVCFGQPGGINPCGREIPTVPTEKVTWSGVKTIFD